MTACFHVPGVACDNCHTGLKDDRPYVATVTTGGTYYSSQDFLAALRLVEIERDEARKERDLLRERQGLVRAYAALRTEFCEIRIRCSENPIDHPAQVERSTELAVLKTVLAMLDGGQ